MDQKIVKGSQGKYVSDHVCQRVGYNSAAKMTMGRIGAP